jgi:glutamine synthetase
MSYAFHEYIWLGDNKTIAVDIRSKTRVLRASEDVSDWKSDTLWNYDGSSTGQAQGNDSEVFLRVVKQFPDPFRDPSKDKLLLCENEKYFANGKKIGCERGKCAMIMEAAKTECPRFGLEQEFFLMDNNTNMPVGYRVKEEPQGNFYCGTIGSCIPSKLRKFYEKFLENCRIATIALSGANFEVAPGQLEFQIDNYGVTCGDHLWMARYIAQRTAQELDCYIEFATRVIEGDFNGSGCHTNFSTASMMAPGGWEYIQKQVLPKLEEKHMHHIHRYGPGNTLRLSGKHETASWKHFSWGVGSRDTSIRIPTDTKDKERGYIEDRRPSSAMNPYVVTGMIVQTILDVCPDIEFKADCETADSVKLFDPRKGYRPLL